MAAGEVDANEGKSVAGNYEHQDPSCDSEPSGCENAGVEPEDREFAKDRCEEPCDAAGQ